MNRRTAVQALFAVMVGSMAVQAQKLKADTITITAPPAPQSDFLLVLNVAETITVEWNGQRRVIKIQEMFDALEGCEGRKCIEVKGDAE